MQILIYEEQCIIEKVQVITWRSELVIPWNWDFYDIQRHFPHLLCMTDFYCISSSLVPFPDHPYKHLSEEQQMHAILRALPLLASFIYLSDIKCLSYNFIVCPFISYHIIEVLKQHGICIEKLDLDKFRFKSRKCR